MACGIGACLCCVENTTEGHLGVTLIDESVERMEGSGKNRVDARAALQVNIEKRNERIQYALTNQKTVEVAVAKKVPYEKCEKCDRTAYQKAKEKCYNRKSQLEDVYKRQVYKSSKRLIFFILEATIRESMRRIPVFSFIMAAMLEENEPFGTLVHLRDVYKRQAMSCSAAGSMTSAAPAVSMVRIFRQRRHRGMASRHHFMTACDM